MNSLKIIIIILILAFMGLFSSAFVINETEQVIVTQFGKLVGEPKTAPGLYFKLPVLQVANFFPKNLLEWDGEPGQIPTLEKTYIWVDSFARWKIVDPIKFFQTVSNTNGALSQLDAIIDPAVRNFVTSYRLIETVRNTNRELDTFELGREDESKNQRPSYAVETGREKISRAILDQAQPKLEKFGIELVDVKIKRINYVDQVQQSVYGRMIAERKQIAEKFRSEGQGEQRKILGEKEKDLKRITSEAYRTAQEVKGKADAEATTIYAQAFGVDPQFYSFVKTLEIYGETLDKESSLVLSTDSDFLKYLKGYEIK
ncbi:MAG: protease modulator HflC [Desulfobacteraceae bacterium]|nr:protease modulator HflC [Desulfobacteraceae bacterium]MBU4052775.1 protease modulator HflC [Pseudomonadota bacterium]